MSILRQNCKVKIWHYYAAYTKIYYSTLYSLTRPVAKTVMAENGQIYAERQLNANTGKIVSK